MATEITGKACNCARARVYLHDGHCCLAIPNFDYADLSTPFPCGHEDEFRALHNERMFAQTLDDLEAAGYQACCNVEPAAPILNDAVRDALVELDPEVGNPKTLEIFRAFSSGHNRRTNELTNELLAEAGFPPEAF